MAPSTALRLWLAASATALLPFSVSLLRARQWVVWTIVGASTSLAWPYLTFPGKMAWLITAGTVVVLRQTVVGRAEGETARPSPLRCLVMPSLETLLLLSFLCGTVVVCIVVGGTDVWKSRGATVCLGLLLAVFVGDDAVVQILRASRHPGLTAFRYNPLIGWIERLAVYLLVALGHVEAAALAFTAKSLARVPQIDKDKDFAEYFLIGTLVSISWAVTLGFAVRSLLKIGSL